MDRSNPDIDGALSWGNLRESILKLVGKTQAQVDADAQVVADEQAQALARQQLNELIPRVINTLLNQATPAKLSQSSGLSDIQSNDPLSQWQDLYSQAGYE